MALIDTIILVKLALKTLKMATGYNCVDHSPIGVGLYVGDMERTYIRQAEREFLEEHQHQMAIINLAIKNVRKELIDAGLEDE